MKTSIFALVAVSLAACGGGGSPIQNRVGEGSVATRVGPGGATVRGEGGTPLEGLILEIPPGALDRLVDLTIDIGPEIVVPGTSAASSPLRIRMVPDPGVLRSAATLTTLVDIPTFRSPTDLVVLGQRSEEQPSAVSTPGPRLTVVADHGELDDIARTFRFDLSTVGDMQVRLVDGGRLTTDAASFVSDGYQQLAELTSTSIVAADLAFSEAQLADPYLSIANLLRAVSRVLVALDDRRDTGPGLDSVGEALLALGIDVDQISLVERFRTGVWPRDVVVPAGGPTISELQAFLRGRLRPVLESALRDLDAVSPDVAAVVSLPAVLTSLPGEREVDGGDLLALRTLFAGMAFWIDWVDDLELEFDAVSVTANPDAMPTIAEFFAGHPMIGRLRAIPSAGTIDAAKEALLNASAAFGAIDGEADAQGDDVFVLTDDASARSRLGQNLAALRDSLIEGGPREVRVRGERVDVDLSAPLASGAFEPAFGVPQFLDFLPLAGTAEQPELGGVLPGMTQARWTEMIGAVSQFTLPEVAIATDGTFVDWAASTAPLDPVDPLGDTRTGVLRAVDLEQCFVASSGDDLAFRVRLASDSIAYRPEQVTAYGVLIRERGPRRLGARIDIVVYLEATGPRVEVSRDGVIRDVTASAAYSGRDLEFTVDRFELFDPDEPLADRVVRGFSDALDPLTGQGDGDRTRWIAVTF